MYVINLLITYLLTKVFDKHLRKKEQAPCQHSQIQIKTLDESIIKF